MLAHRLRRRPNIVPTLGQRLVFPGIYTLRLSLLTCPDVQSQKAVSAYVLFLALQSKE